MDGFSGWASGMPVKGFWSGRGSGPGGVLGLDCSSARFGRPRVPYPGVFRSVLSSSCLKWLEQPCCLIAGLIAACGHTSSAMDWQACRREICLASAEGTRPCSAYTVLL